MEVGVPVKKGARQIFLIFLAYYGMTCVSNAYFLFGPFYESLGASPQAAGLFLSVFYMVMLPCRPLGSVLLERFDIRRSLLASSLACFVSTAGIALSLNHSAILLFFRALSGLSVSVFVVSAIAAQSILLDDKTRGFGFALFTTGSMLPLATVVPLCEWLLKKGYGAFYVWVPAFIALACMGVSYITENLNYSEKEGKNWGSYSELFTAKGFAVLLMTAIIMSLADAATLSVASLSEARNVSVSAFMIASAAAAVVIRTMAFRAISRIPRVKLAAPAAACMGFALMGLSFCSSSWGFVAFGLLFGLGIGVAYPTTLSLVGDMLPAEYHPKAAGLLLLVIDVGWVVSPLVYGYCSPFLGISNTYRLAGALVFVSASALYFQYWRKFVPSSRA